MSDTPAWGDGLPRARPEARGVDPQRMQAFLDEASGLGVELNSFMLWKGGAVVGEGWWWPYRPELPHMMHSATKSFLSAAVGLAVAEGRFGLEDRVLDFFDAWRPASPSGHLRRMTVGDLLTQTSGHAQGASGSVWRSIPTSWITEFFRIPVRFEPGTRFRYTSATSFLLSAIISRTTGQTCHDYLRPRLLEPLGIEGLSWDLGPENINPGGNGISCRTADLLKLAVLHLRGGAWEGRQVLPAAWVRQATAPQRGNPYGFHWWVGPGGSFYAYGVFGQFAFAFPDHDAVLALTAAVPNGEETLRSLVWAHFPGLFDERPARRLPALRDWAKLRLLPELPRSTRPAHVPLPAGVYAADANEDGVIAVRIGFGADRCTFGLTDKRGEHEVVVGLHDWLEGETTMSGAVLHHGYEPGRMRVVAAGSWLDACRFEMSWQFNETAFRDRVVLAFGPGELTMTRSVNTNSGACIRPEITARQG